MDSFTEQLWQAAPFTKTCGIKAIEVAPDAVRLAMDWTPPLTTAGGTLHGGAVMSLADAAGALLAYLNLPEGANGTTTIESKTNFLAGVREGTLTATSTLLHKGRTSIVVETELRNDEGRLVAKTTQTQAVLR